MAVSKEYIADLVASLNATIEREKQGEPAMVIYGVGIDYEGCHRYFVSLEAAQAFQQETEADYVEEINVW